VTFAFDTSVLVPGLVGAHPLHERSRRWLAAARSGAITGIMSWHAVAEAWSVLTRLPLEPAISGEAAQRLLESVRAFITPVEPDASVYTRAIALCAARGFRSGAVFDAIHLATAEVQGADAILTWNRYDFERLTSGGSPRVASPDEDPLAPTT
jgi:predicted nucleic acid-binding protein